MNLQVCMPYEPCPFKCPSCIANGRKRYDNLFDSDIDRYFKKLHEGISQYDYDNFVITGDSEPTLNRHWMRYVLNELKDEHIELQTRNYNLKGYNLKHLDVLAYSITDSRSYLNAWRFRKIDGDNRLVILLTKEFNFLTAKNFNSMGFNQITFKVLQETADEKTNQWIRKNRMQDLTNIYEIVERFNGSAVSVRLDDSCQDSHGRYNIFRSDGHFYDSWENEEPFK